MAATFTAQYHSACAACDEEIRPGQTCAWVEDHAVHAVCEGAPITNLMSSSRMLRDPCGKCWTVPAANGACACEED